MFEAAVIAWLVALIGDRGIKGLTRAIFGTPRQRAMSTAMHVAMTPLMESIPAPSRADLAEALTERFSDPPPVVLDGRTPVRAGLISAIRQQLAPLADPDVTATGESYLELKGIDPAPFIDEFTAVVLTSICQVAASDSALSNLAAQLNADESHEAEGTILAKLAKVELVLQGVEHLLRAPDPRSASQATSSRNGPAVAGAPAKLPPGAIERLVDGLLEIPAVINDNSRNIIQDMLEAEMDGGISHHIVPRLQAIAWVQECPNRDGGLNRLISIIRLVEGNSQAMRRLDDTILAIGPQIGGEQVTGTGQVSP